MSSRAPFNNPLDPATVDRALAMIEAGPGDFVLDVGCGGGEMLARILERLPCQGVGVDSNPEEIRHAEQRLAPFGSRARLHARPVKDVALDPGRFAAAVCVGASHAFALGADAYPSALEALSRWVRPGGLLLVGEGFWRREPEPEYLDAAGDGLAAAELRPHADNVALAEAMGLVPLMAVASSNVAWDAFETASWAAAEERLREAPSDPKALERAEKKRRWRRAYLQWGRTTMGFAMYVFRNRG